MTNNRKQDLRWDKIPKCLSIIYPKIERKTNNLCASEWGEDTCRKRWLDISTVLVEIMSRHYYITSLTCRKYTLSAEFISVKNFCAFVLSYCSLTKTRLWGFHTLPINPLSGDDSLPETETLLFTLFAHESVITGCQVIDFWLQMRHVSRR